MGLTHVTVTVKASLSSRKKYAADFLVDTGATDSMASGTALRKAGLTPVGKTTYELADGTPSTNQTGVRHRHMTHIQGSYAVR